MVYSPVFELGPVANGLDAASGTSWTTVFIVAAILNRVAAVMALLVLKPMRVKFVAESANAILRRNLLIYGVGGIIAPFIGIKLIDVIISALGVK